MVKNSLKGPQAMPAEITPPTPPTTLQAKAPLLALLHHPLEGRPLGISNSGVSLSWVALWGVALSRVGLCGVRLSGLGRLEIRPRGLLYLRQQAD